MHMNFFKRATTSILRRPGKTIILLLLVFILGSVIAGAISVRGAIGNTDANLRRNMQPIVSVSFDWQTWDGLIDWDDYSLDIDDLFANRPILTPTQVRAIGDLPYVGFYDYMIISWFDSFELQPYMGDEEPYREEWEPQWQRVRGTSTTSLVQIQEEFFDLVQGRQFTENELVPGADRSVAIISDIFADLNNLSIGSTFELYEFVFYPNEEGRWAWEPEKFADENIYEQVGMEFEVIGLFEVPLDPEWDSWGHEYLDRRHYLNSIYVPNWAVEDVWNRTEVAERSSWEDVDYAWIPEIVETRAPEVTPIFILDDPAYLNDFREAATELVPEFHIVEDLSSAFEDISSSMATLQGIANWILWVSVGATLLILSLLITLFLRDRRYEMGVYLALGERRGRIVSQILLEVVVTSFVGITLAVFTGNIISSVISQNMLVNELTAEQSDDPWGGGRGNWTAFDEFGIPTTSMSVDEMMDAFDVSLTIQTVSLFYAVGLGAVMLSTMIPVLYVVKLSPKKVLM